MEEPKLKDVVNYLLKDRHKYKTLSVKAKEDNFFIINRFLSKKFPEQAQKFNNKKIDKSLALDLWFLYLRHQKRSEIFRWFWSKVPKTEKTFTDSEVKLLMNKLQIRKEDLEILKMYHMDFLKEELKYFKELKDV
jgi:hypothetical protein